MAEMRASTGSVRRQDLIGSLWMVTSMIAFSFEDVCLKLASGGAAVSQIMVAFGAVGMALCAALCGLGRHSLIPRGICHPAMVLRFFFEVFGRLFFTLSLVLGALGSTVAILQATPLVTVAGAALVFREKVSPARWAALGVGLGGVMIILRPAASDFTILSVLAVFGMLGLALRDLATRAVPRSVPNAALGFYSFAAVVAAGIVQAMWIGVPVVLPGRETAPLLLGAAIAGVFGTVALTQAMRTGDVSAVTPFRYTRLLCGACVGVILFDERFSAMDLFGAGLIVGSGLCVLLRSGRPAAPR